MAELSKVYRAKGELTTVDMKLTETTKEGVFVHNLKDALKNFEGLEVTISISYKEEIVPEATEA